MGNGNKIGEENQKQDVLSFDASEKIENELKRIEEVGVETCDRPTRNHRESILFSIVDEYGDKLSSVDARRILELRKRIYKANKESFEPDSFNQLGFLIEKSKENHPSQNCDNSMWSITKRKGYEFDEKKTIEENRKAERVYYGESHPCDVDEEDM